MLLFCLLCGRWLDRVMRDRARGGVTALLRNMGTGAMVVGADETSRWVDATALQPGMVMRVAAGERLAADGVMTGGASRIDKSEEHTSELQSLMRISYAVFCLKNKK